MGGLKESSVVIREDQGKVGLLGGSQGSRGKWRDHVACLQVPEPSDSTASLGQVISQFLAKSHKS